MKCRHSLILALGLLGGAGGCASTFSGWTNDSAAPATAAAAKPSVEKVYKPSTYVTLGDFRVESAFAKETPPAFQKQYREDARKAYLKAIEVDPKYVPAYLALARLLQKCEDFNGAVGIYDRALQINPREGDIWFDRAVCECRTKNFNGAIDDLHKACELEPTNRQYSTTLGLTLARAGRYDESYAVLARDGGEAKAHSDLARMLLHLNQPELARQQALLALNKDPSQQAAQSLLATLAEKSSSEGVKVQPVGYQQNN